ncbi:hypothetical protein SISSUDRAFT_1131678 [Sistotremastrum suecicum HHB10207 ss-3]|uniref:F-box domain-containing protein n=1 Tax=Sistotremastrum suecicum HHB10207 ss-3 TaxID=1314776 RepID=A0A165ZVX5_9AGAM|nr:hypothetical protein SISSUDRAFT_1131678 [Sistotremastrum suecicum HHB10207 ss-3]
MPSFSGMPHEMLLHILDGATVADILSVVLTSHSPYILGRTSRVLWRNAADHVILPLPAEYNIDDVPIERLFGLALRAISIARSLRELSIVPKRFSAAGPIEDGVMHSNMPVHGGRWSLYDSEHGIRCRDTNIRNENPDDSDSLVLPGSSLSRSIVVDRGGGVFRSVQSMPVDQAQVEEQTPQDPQRLKIPHIVDICFPNSFATDNEVPHISGRPIPIPGVDAERVLSITDSFMIIWGMNDPGFVYLLDYKRRIGIQYLLMAGSLSFFEFSSAQIHPSLPKLILLVRVFRPPETFTCAVWIIDIPPNVFSGPQPDVDTDIPITWTPVETTVTSEFLTPMNWTPDISYFPEFPESYTLLHQLSLRDSEGRTHATVVCLTPDNTLVAASLGHLHRPFEFVPRGVGSQSPTMGLWGDGIMILSYFSCLGRTLEVGTFVLPTSMGSAVATNFDPVQGKLIVEVPYTFDQLMDL